MIFSERFWNSHFGRDPKLVGSSVQLDGEPYTVIGILPARFQFRFQSDFWTPFVVKRSPEQRRIHYLQVIGRLRPGVSLSSARADMAMVAKHISDISPETNKGWGVTIEPMRQALVGHDLRVTSLVLVAVVGFVLLLACANIANLLLARGAVRAREIAVRSALGGSRSRIVRQLLTESLLLAVVGGAAGIGLASVVLQEAPSFLPEGMIPVTLRLGLDIRVVAFSAALTLATAVLFGLAPAWQAARRPLADSLRVSGRTSTGSGRVLRSALAIGQVAIAVLLAAGAGLLLRTLGSLNRVDPGFRAPNVLTMTVVLPLSAYPTPEHALRFYQKIEEAIRRVPGVRDVGLGTVLPTDGWDIGQGFEVVGQPPLDEADQPAANYQMVSSDYFKTLGIRLLKGREFAKQDNESSTPVCIVNEEFARRYLAGRDPIGAIVGVQAMDPSGPKLVKREVVGVINQVKVEGLGEKENDLEIYVPLAQNAWYWAAIAVRADRDPIALLPSVRLAVARVDQNMPVTHVRTMDEVAAESIAEPRFRAQLVSSFAALAVILASVGVFGVIALSVSQRTREFGIRLALGARTSEVLSLVLGDGLKITLVGLVIGVAGAVGLTRFLSLLLFGVKPLDPLSFFLSAGLLAIVAIVACAAPALKASTVDPLEALRQE